MQKVAQIIGLAIGCLAVAALVWAMRYHNQVQAAAEAQFGTAELCWFDGDYSGSGVPMVQGGADSGGVVHPWQDFRNSVLISDGAKPFHFGVRVRRGNGQPDEIWGWSYRNAAFWQNKDARAFKLMTLGDLYPACGELQ